MGRDDDEIKSAAEGAKTVSAEKRRRRIMKIPSADVRCMGSIGGIRHAGGKYLMM